MANGLFRGSQIYAVAIALQLRNGLGTDVTSPRRSTRCDRRLDCAK
ncbi:hypothetical protein [Laspinema palackyanum]|nr:hypothetical protein [Laspinema sp. D2c]